MLIVNPFAIPPFLSSLVMISIGIYALIKNPRSPTHRGLFYFCLSLFIWLFGYTFMYCSIDSEVALKWARLGFVGIAFIASTNCYFNLNLLGVKDKRLFVVGIFSCSILLCLASQTPLVYRGIGHFFWGPYPLAGKYYWLFMAYYIVTWLYGLLILYKQMHEKKKSKDFLAYNQIKYVYIAWLGGSIGIVDFLPKYGIPIYPFAYIIALYWVLISTFALIRFRLLSDISFLTRRALIYSIFFVVMLVLFGQCYTLIRILETHFIHLNLTLMLVGLSVTMGIIFQPLYRKIKYLVDKTFYPENVEKKEKLNHISKAIILSKSPVEFNRIILESIHTFFKSIKASLFLWNEKERAYLMQSSTGWGIQMSNDTVTRIYSNHCIPVFLIENDYLIYDIIRRDSSNEIDQKALTAAMLELEASICVPIKKEGKLHGILILGDKESGLPYGLDDRKTLKILADQSIIALENLNLFKRWNDGVTQTHQMNQILHRYMSPSVADEVLKRVDNLQSWKGDKRYVAVLMADLRDFTRISGNYDPEEVVQWLNEYFAELIETIISNGGTVDKFMGDAVLAVFGAPTPLPNVELRAVTCAVEMHHCIRKLNKKRSEQGLFSLQMGIAVTAGDVVAGNIGSDKRMEYTVIGDAVNLVSRLQSLANNGQVLTSANVAEKILAKVDAKRLPPVYVKGKNTPLEIYEIFDLKSEPGTNQHNSLPSEDDDNQISQAP